MKGYQEVVVYVLNKQKLQLCTYIIAIPDGFVQFDVLCCAVLTLAVARDHYNSKLNVLAQFSYKIVK